MVTVETIKKSWKNAVLAKHAANDWPIYERSGKHSTNLKGFQGRSQDLKRPLQSITSFLSMMS